MERYLEEIESLKRRKWITEKENKEMKEQVGDLKEKIKKLKDDNRRFLKKTGEMRDRERA
jgi:cell division protein FtsB